MLPQVRTLPFDASFALMTDHPRCKILESRHQYTCCHIFVPEETDRLPAVKVGKKYFSFFKLIQKRQKTLQVAARLVYRGDEVVITTTAKGDALWIHEPEAEVRSASKPIAENPLWRILESDRDFQTCQILVPDVDKPLAAILVDYQYYSFLRVVRDEEQGIELAERLARKGNESIITKNARSCVIWVLELDATLNRSGAR